MAYQTRYTASLLGRDGVQYVVRLLEDGFSGTPVELTAAADGASLTWGERGREVFEPLLASRLEVTLSVPETEALDEALAAATAWWRMELEANGQTVWRGVVVTDTVERELYRPRYRVRLAASDGLGLLADVLYLQADGTPWSGRAPLVVHLARALSPLDFDMDIAVAVPWLPSQASGSGCGLDAEVDAAAFARDGRVISCLDVIREICARFNARIYQHGGRWYVTQRALETGSDYQLRIYDASGVFQATETRLGQATPGGVVMRGTRTFRPAVAALGERYRHGPIPSLIKGGSFEEPGTGGYGQLPQPAPSDLWAEYGTNTQNDFVTLPRGFYSATSAQTLLPEFKAVANRAGFVEAIFHGNTRDPAQVRQAIYNSGRYLEQVGDVVTAGQKLAFFAEVILPYHEGEGKGLYMTYFALNIVGTNWYAKRDGTWAQSSNEADWVQPIMDEGSEWGETGLPLKKTTYPDDWTRIQLFFDAAPATGPVRLRLYGSSDISGNRRDVKGAVWDNVQLIVVGDESGAAASATDYDVWTQAAGQQLERRETLLGQGPTSSVPGALTWGGVLATDWQGGTLGPMSLHQLALESRLRAMMRPLEVIHEVWSLTGLEPGRAVVRSGGAYAVHYLKRDLLRAMEEVELVRVRLETGTVFFGSLAAAEGISVVVGGESAGTVQTVSTTVDLSPAYRTGPFATLQSAVSAGSVSQLVVDSVGGIPFLQLPPAGAYIRLVHPVTGTIVDAYVESALLDMSGTSATLEVRDVSDTTQPLTLPEDFPAGAPVWLSAIWALANAEAKVPRSLWQAKGDLIAADGTGAPARLPVGQDGQILAADSTEAVGLKWIDPPSGGGSTVTDLGVSMHAVRRGTATIGATQTSVTVPVAVSEGLDQSKVQVTPLTTLGAATRFWVANVTSGSFDIVLDAQPGQNVTFAWWVIDDSEIAYVEVIDFYWSGYFSGVSNITLTIPTTTQQGDLLLAILMTRPGSPPPTTTGPTGWTRHDWAWTYQPSWHHYIEAWTRVASAGDAGQNVTFTQPASERMAGLILVLRSSVSGRTPAIVRTLKIEDQELVSQSAPVRNAIPVVGVPIIGGIEIGCYTNVFAAGPTTILFTDDWTQLTPISTSDNRLGVAWRHVYPGIAPAADIQNYSTEKYWASLALVVAP